MRLEAVHKRRQQSGRRVFSSADVLRTWGGGLQMWMSALFGAKIIGFFEIYGVSARTRGVKSVRTFFGKGERGQFFAILCRRLLWTAPYQNHF